LFCQLLLNRAIDRGVFIQQQPVLLVPKLRMLMTNLTAKDRFVVVLVYRQSSWDEFHMNNSR
jgi:hypothetical protein